MKTKPSILVFVDWFYPGYLAGGPVQSIVSLVEHLHPYVDFWIFTSDRDHNSKVAYPGIETNTWLESELKCKVFYAKPETLGKSLVADIFEKGNFDMVYINSLFSKFYSIVPLLVQKKKFRRLPVIVAPRGMFGGGALSIKRNKKRFFLIYAKITGLHKNVIWHATSLQEKSEILSNEGKNAKVVTIANVPKRLKGSVWEAKRAGELKLFFNARVSAKKNILFALETLSQVQKTKVRFDIFGTVEDETYWKTSLEKIKQLPDNVKANYLGTYRPEETQNILSGEEVMILPTLNENYGHSIVESLSAGCPVIISDQTPWNDLENHGAGFALPLSHLEKFVDAIEKYGAMDETEFKSCRENAISYINRKIDLDSIVQQYRDMFHG